MAVKQTRLTSHIVLMPALLILVIGMVIPLLMTIWFSSRKNMVPFPDF